MIGGLVPGWFAQGDYLDYGTDFRTQFFYSPPYALPVIILLDNLTRSLIPRAEPRSALTGATNPFRAQVTAPVLLLQAELDHIFVPQDDTALYSSASDVEYVVLEHAGHKGFLHPASRQAAVREVVRWLDERF